MEQVRQFSYILKSGIGMRVWQHGQVTMHAIDVFTDDSGLHENTLSHSLLFTQQLQLLN
jgi:hypothetical protein